MDSVAAAAVDLLLLVHDTKVDRPLKAAPGRRCAVPHRRRQVVLLRAPLIEYGAAAAAVDLLSRVRTAPCVFKPLVLCLLLLRWGSSHQ